MLAHLPVLQVIVPLIAAPCCLMIRSPAVVGRFVQLATLATLIISLGLVREVLEQGVLSYALGGWQAPWGIEYRIDPLNVYLLVLVSLLGTIVIFAAPTSIKSEIAEDKQTYFYVAYLLCFAGLLGILATGDAFNVFVFLEISSLSSYTLIALGQDRRALWASYQYLIMGTIGATFILIGIGLMYMMTGTLNMHDLATRLDNVSETNTIFTAFAFLFIGVCLKLALFPLHLWLPNAYTYAPSLVTAFLAATATKVAIYILLRFVFSVFGAEFSLTYLPVREILLVLGLMGVVFASTVAIYQTNVKKLFAYSSVAQIGYMILGLSIGSAAGLMATLLHMFNHALMKGALFLALTSVAFRLKQTNLTNMAGIGRQMPLTMAAVVVGGLSLIGTPLTVGFISKWYLVLAAIEQGWWPLAFVVLFGSLLALIYVWRIVETAYFQPISAELSGVREAPVGILVPMWVLVLLNIYFGIDSQFTVSLSELAAHSLYLEGR